MRNRINLSDQLVAAESRMNMLVSDIRSTMTNQLSELVKKDEYVANTTELAKNIEEVKSSQERLETDFVGYQFEVEDNFDIFRIEINETVLDVRAIIEEDFQEQIAKTEIVLIEEITKKLNKLNENMKKFSDVSSMGANELRALIESEIVELQVKN